MLIAILLQKNHGIIEKITANTGTITVNVGDEVTEKSILIGGYMEGKFTGTRYVHARRRSISKSIL